MFDSLKEKLNRFESDVEAEADVQEVDEEEAEATSGTEAESSGETGDQTDEATADSESPGLRSRVGSLARGKVVIDEDDLEGPLEDLRLALLESDVAMETADTILEDVRADLVGETRGLTTSTGSVVRDALREALLDVVSVGQFDVEARISDSEKPVTLVFTGVNGVGKTTTIAKLARHLEAQGFSTVLANGDTYRAGATEQIEEHADRLGLKLISHEQGGDPTAVVYDAVEYARANDVDVVLGDTAGRLHTSTDLMAQLEKLDRVVEPDMTLFVDEAVAGKDAVNRAREFNEAASIDGAILTKADADSQGGAAISIAHVTGRPILYLGTGQGYEDIERFEPETFVDRLLAEE
ncbi:MAG: signal recognition particle-docking protein FtsY [Halobacteriaceae archaeon]